MAQRAVEAFISSILYFIFSVQALTHSVDPPFTLLTLQDKVVLCVLSLTEMTETQTGTRSTQTVVLLPITVETRGGGATLDTPHTPLAFPGSFRYCMKGRVQAVGVVADVTVVT